MTGTLGTGQGVGSEYQKGCEECLGYCKLN